MNKVAILIDGGFYRKRIEHIAKTVPEAKTDSPEKAVDFLISYCKRHYKGDELYRIFYYDCKPSDKKIYHPFHKNTVDLKKSELFTYMTTFLDTLKKQRKVALRLGRLSDERAMYNLRYEVVKKLFNGTKTIEELTEYDFELIIEQKGVDMKIGVDIASLAYKKQVDKIILISGDSDFVPASKLARREGIDFVLDPMWADIKPDLFEHIDGLKSRIQRPRP